MDFIEISRVVLGIFILLFIFQNYAELKEKRNSKIIIVAFIFLFFGWFFDLIDDLFYVVLNFLQHTILAIGLMIFALWYWKEFHGGDSDGNNYHN
jgi:hypothetical protein